jgi:hypothetical protein
VFYGIGDYPFCKGGHGRARGIVVGDDIPGGMWQENGFSQPIKVHSWSELHRRLAAEGLQIAPRYVEGSKHLTKWVSVDLEAAKALVSRGVTSTTAPTGPGGLALLEPHPDYPITVTDAGWTITSREATRE